MSISRMTKDELINTQAHRMCEILNGIDRGEITDEDLVDLQTFVAIAIELHELKFKNGIEESGVSSRMSPPFKE